MPNVDFAHYCGPSFTECSTQAASHASWYASSMQSAVPANPSENQGILYRIAQGFFDLVNNGSSQAQSTTPAQTKKPAEETSK
jgi:hypothetical protein